MKKTILLLIICVLFTVCLSACDNTKMQATDEMNENVKNNEVVDDAKENDEKSIIWTIDFTMQVPEYWVGKYIFDLNPKGDKLDVSMITQKSENGALLFSIFINPLEERDTIIENLEFGIEPIGLLESKDGHSYFLGLRYASEMVCEEFEEEIFLNLINSIPEVIETLTPSEGCKILEWKDDYLTEVDDAPYVSLNLSIIGCDFNLFKNQHDGVIYKMENPQVFGSHHIVMDKNVEYYYTDNNELIGVVDGKIVLYSAFCDYMFADNSSHSVRDVFNGLELTNFFGVTPKYLSVDNRAVGFYYWAIDNGYAGVIAVGGNNPQQCYDYTAIQFIASQNRDLINIHQ